MHGNDTNESTMILAKFEHTRGVMQLTLWVGPETHEIDQDTFTSQILLDVSVCPLHPQSNVIMFKTSAGL